MNWENIRYIIQIPLDWYKKIHARVFGAYGTNFIVVKDGDDGAMQIDVDDDCFKQAVGAAVDLGDVVYSVDGHSPDSNGAVSFGLSSSKWMKTDASGHVSTTDETPIALPAGYTGQDSTFTVVTDVTWNGTTLQKKTRQLTYKSGALVTVGTEATSTIDTPVAYS